MEKQLKDILPIMGVEHDCILSKHGDITIVFQATLPEIFTLSDDEYETLHQAWIKAVRTLPDGTVLHKQDWFITQNYHSVRHENNSFLNESSDRYFDGRPFTDHDCYILLTKKVSGRKWSTSLFSNLLRPAIVPEETLKPSVLHEFSAVSSQFKQLIDDSRLIRLKRLGADELQSSLRKPGLIERYCYLPDTANQLLYKDISLKDEIMIGTDQVVIYTLGDAADLPALCGARINHDTYSTDKTKFPVSFAASLGLLLPCNHIYNQYIFIGDEHAALKELEKKRLRLHSLAAYSRENAISLDATNSFLNEAIGEQRSPVKAHFNVMCWSDNPDEIKDMRNRVSSALAGMDAAAKPETVGAAQIWWAGMPGNEANFPVNDTFDTFTEQACCFLNLESNYKSAAPDQGIRFCDRVSGRPVFVDLYDAPRGDGITSNMGTLICGTSGGGKSMTSNHILRTLFDQGAHCVTVDIGGSYRGLCELTGGYYFTYEESNPIRFNPFYLSPGTGLDTEKKESLKALLVALWKQENESFNRSEYVALSNALQGYYQQLKNAIGVFPCFDTFYEYLKKDYIGVLKDHQVRDRDFDVDNFLYVLRPYYRGGEFDYLLNARENLDLLNQPFIVFELDEIKDHPILFPIVTLIIMELFISKMRKLPGKRKVLIIDEAWKAIAKSGMAEFLKYAFKTIRKFNGIPIVITQELDDLISSPIIKDAIINNADIKILMDMRKFQGKIEKLQDALGMSEKGKTILLSVNKDNREVFIDIGGQVMKVFKNELCPEEYYTYTTEGSERVKVMRLAEQYGSFQKGVEAMINEKYTIKDNKL
ncbi:MAG: TraG family conjugative transposon ATPase [Sphingobacteriales bacterium]